MIRLIVPAPPSANALFKNGGKSRQKTRVYNAWLSECGWRVKLQCRTKSLGRSIVVLAVERGSLGADVDNTIKPLCDMLVECGVLPDDRYVTAVAVSWLPAPDKSQRKAIISIYPAEYLAVEFVPGANAAYGGWHVASNAQTQDDEHAIDL